MILDYFLNNYKNGSDARILRVLCNFWQKLLILQFFIRNTIMTQFSNYFVLLYVFHFGKQHWNDVVNAFIFLCLIPMPSYSKHIFLMNTMYTSIVTSCNFLYYSFWMYCCHMFMFLFFIIVAADWCAEYLSSYYIVHQ